MSYDKMDSSAVYKMFEEIKSILNKKPEATIPATQSIEIGNIAELREITLKLEEVAKTVGKPQEHIHKHRIDLMSNKVLIVLVVALSALVISLWIVSDQRQTIGQFRDNDLKYRYIQMKGKATSEEILMLREVFDYNRNADSIRLIRQRVERYERIMQEQAEKVARATLTAEEAEELKQKADKIKGN